MSRDSLGRYLKGHTLTDGKHQSPATEFKAREKHPKWKGGIYKKKEGYIKVKDRNHPYCDAQGYVCQHRLVMEKHVGRYLNPKERVHHINRRKDDNRIENLKLFSSESEHQKLHNPVGKQ